MSEASSSTTNVCFGSEIMRIGAEVKSIFMKCSSRIIGASKADLGGGKGRQRSHNPAVIPDETMVKVNKPVEALELLVASGHRPRGNQRHFGLVYRDLTLSNDASKEGY